MKRREFITLLGGAAAALPLAAGAADQRRIVILHSGFPNRTPIDRLYNALNERGYRAANIELLGGEGDPDRLKMLVAQIVEQKPDVTIALTSPAARGLKQANLSAPVVFVFVPDPIGQGIIGSLAHPGGNFTGITYSETAIGSKRLGIILDVVPSAQRVAIVWGSGFPENVGMVKAIETSAQTRKLSVFSREVSKVHDLPFAFDEASAFGAAALVFLTDNLMFGHRKEVAALALSHHLPSIHAFSPEVKDGGLLSYGADLEESYQRAAALVDRILRGSSPADLPVEEPTRFDLAVNLKTANALGLTIPPGVLAIADEVIE
jgi:putative tryptophan/tyrosine transport system substrate-binding protein